MKSKHLERTELENHGLSHTVNTEIEPHGALCFRIGSRGGGLYYFKVKKSKPK